MTEIAPWATLTLTIDPSRASAAAWAADLDALDALAGLAAGLAGVEGTERRDPSTFGAPARVELVVYAAVADAPALEPQLLRLADDLGLRVHLRVEVHDEDYRDAWKAFYTAQVFGDPPGGLLVRPSWIPRAPGQPEAEIVLDPGRAFGTGLHASTRLCLRWICAVPHPDPGTQILDLGCGSGILGVAAARLWGCPTLFVDFDPESTDTAQENAELNDLARLTRTLTGELSDVPAAERFSRILANIRPSVLLPIAQGLVARLAPDGRAVLSGILSEEGPEVLEAYRAVGAAARIYDELEEWCSIEVVRAP